jgi:hypothetical protein
MESYDLIKYKYEIGVYSLDYLCRLVDTNKISKQEFHMITSYNYTGVKQRKEGVT